LSQVCAATAAVFALAALGLMFVAPGASAGRTVGESPITLISVDGTSALVEAANASPAATGVPSASREHITVHRAGETDIDGVHVQTYEATVSGSGAQDQPSALTLERIAELNGGRLPLGIKSTATSVPASYQDKNVLTIAVEPLTGSLVDARWDEKVTATLDVPAIGTVVLDQPIAQGTRVLSKAQAASAAAVAHQAVTTLSDRDAMHDWAWTLGVLALLASAAAAALLISDRRKPAAAPAQESLPAGDSALRTR
jgi:hypothetical protein